MTVGRVVYMDTSGFAQFTTGAGQKIIGIVEYIDPAFAYATIFIGKGRISVKNTGGLTAGDRVGSAANGTVAKLADAVAGDMGSPTSANIATAMNNQLKEWAICSIAATTGNYAEVIVP